MIVSSTWRASDETAAATTTTLEKLFNCDDCNDFVVLKPASVNVAERAEIVVSLASSPSTAVGFVLRSNW